jgi:hypothetical protein
MKAVRTLLIRCQELGATLIPGSDGKLKVRAPAPLPEEIYEALRQYKAEVLAVLSHQQGFPPWLCERCGLPVDIEAVERRRADGVLLTFWCCRGCRLWAVTPATLREPPSG